MPIQATFHPEDSFNVKRQVSGLPDNFRARSQLSQAAPDTASQWEINEGYPLGWFHGPTPGDPDYVPEPGEGSTLPTPTAPTVTTQESSWYENPWILGGLAIGGLLLVGYLAKSGMFASMDDDWSDLGYDGDYAKGRDMSGLANMTLSGDCGCNG